MSATEQKLREDIFVTINQGWLVVKIIETIFIAVFYSLTTSHLADYLLLIAILNIPHNAFGMVACYFQYLYPDYNNRWIWMIQACLAATIRVIEQYINFKIISAISISDLQIKIFRVLNIISCIGLFGGRVYDVMELKYVDQEEARWGMTIVSVSGLISSVFGTYLLISSKNQLAGENHQHNNQSKRSVLVFLNNSSGRMIFIQLIDVFLIFSFSWGRTNYHAFWLSTIFDNLDNCRGLLLAMDLTFSKISALETNFSQMCDNDDIGRTEFMVNEMKKSTIIVKNGPFTHPESLNQFDKDFIKPELFESANNSVRL